MKTECSKCSAPMTPVPAGAFGNLGAILRAPMTITGYRCDKCGHWNDLKRRKGYKEWRAATEAKD